MTGSEAYAKKLEDPRWQDLRLRIIRRDNGRCCNCWSPHHLQVHHIAYLPGVEPWDHPDSMLATLCRRCHERVTGIEDLDPRFGKPAVSFLTPPRIGG